jgi:hypothetical protein
MGQEDDMDKMFTRFNPTPRKMMRVHQQDALAKGAIRSPEGYVAGGQCI